jgi:glycosyltransferase involved in cell wall biosynthesis
MNHFTIGIDVCNQKDWIAKSLDSAIRQDYDNFDIVVVDAKSGDGTWDIIQKYRHIDPKLKIRRNDIRVPQIANICNLVDMCDNPDTIFVSLDGDDWFPNTDVLKLLNRYYTDEVWMTYGTYEEYPYRSVSHIYEKYPDSVIRSNGFREHRWLGSHLRTFRKKLFNRIDRHDFKRNDGEWLDTCGDMAFQFPMLEMSGERSRYIEEITLIYNVANVTRDGTVNEKRQRELEKFVRNKRKYIRLDKL